MNSPMLAASVLALASPVFATTVVVDDDGGSGVDFTTIAAAVAAAQPGDVILVRPGTYPWFVIDKGVAVLGSGGVVVTGGVAIENVPPGPRVSLCGMRLPSLDVFACAAPVVATDLVFPSGTYAFSASVRVRGSADVRFRALTIVQAVPTSGGIAGMIVETSRVELTHSIVEGWRGDNAQFFSNGGSGGPGLIARAGADVHVSHTSLRGGHGGDYVDDLCGSCRGGSGGSAILVQPGGRVLVTGTPADVARGGNGGRGVDCAYDGLPGAGLATYAAGESRHSEVTFLGGYPQPDCSLVPVPPFLDAGVRVEAVPIDASLRATGPLTPGTLATFTLRGAAGDSARLRLGRQLALVDVVDVFEDRLLVPLRTYDLGTLPASGEATFTFPLPAALPEGFLIVAQGGVTSATGETRLSQSLPIVLR